MLELAKQLKVIRAIYGDSAKQMAKKLNISAAYLSVIENGARNAPKGFYESITEKYDLTDTQKNDLKSAIALTASNIKIDMRKMPLEQKEILYTLSQSRLDTHTLEKINNIINVEQESNEKGGNKKSDKKDEKKRNKK